jgi:hypothetical protein
VRHGEFAGVVAVAQDSAFWRAVMWLVTGWRAAWASSAAVAAGRSLVAPMLAWSAETWVRFSTMTIAWAGIGYGVSQFLLPAYVRSALPVAWTATLVLAPLLVAAIPHAFVLAWRERFRSGQKSMP